MTCGWFTDATGTCLCGLPCDRVDAREVNFDPDHNHLSDKLFPHHDSRFIVLKTILWLTAADE